MRIPMSVATAGLLSLLLSAPAMAGVQNITIFDCGRIDSPDRSLWSPGVDVGVFHEMVASCYLIRHDDGLMMWDVGINDAIGDMPEGLTVAGGKIHLEVKNTLADQMAAIDVAATDIDHIAFSHTHPDHTGNANRFTKAVWYIQEAEYDAAFGPDAAKFNFNPALYEGLKDNEIVKLKGNRDIFGDGSVVILSTPGHTPGHQSLLVMLPETGPIVLSGDLWHFRTQFENRRVPAFNFDKYMTLHSMSEVQDLLKERGGTLWIQHDKEQNRTLPHAPDSVR